MNDCSIGKVKAQYHRKVLQQRYIHRKEVGNQILIFVREFKNDIAGTAPYAFLGTADFLKSEGSKPMNIT